MSVKDEIESTLQDLGLPVFYGVGKFKGRDTWDCVVFGKRQIENTGSTKRDFSQIWFVAIVCEEEIPEGLEIEAMHKMRDIGFKRTNSAAAYNYLDKSGECAVEVCVVEFFRLISGC